MYNNEKYWCQFKDVAKKKKKVVELNGKIWPSEFESKPRLWKALSHSFAIEVLVVFHCIILAHINCVLLLHIYFCKIALLKINQFNPCGGKRGDNIHHPDTASVMLRLWDEAGCLWYLKMYSETCTTTEWKYPFVSMMCWILLFFFNLNYESILW